MIMYRRWWAVPGLLFCISVLYAFLAEVVFFRVGAESPRAALWLLAAALFVLAGLALRRLCTRRAILLGDGALLLFTLLFSAVSAIPAPEVSQQFWGLAVLWEYEFGVVLQGLLPQTLPNSYWLQCLISALAPFLWVPFGRAELRP